MLVDSAQIGPRKPAIPVTQLARVKRIKDNRDLYNGKLGQLQVINSLLLEPMNVNWFRKVAMFFPEFMFSERPIIATDNERFNEVIEFIDPITPLHFTNLDMLRYGTGVLATDPYNPFKFMTYEPDEWYVVVDKRNRSTILQDILITQEGSDMTPEDPKRFVVVRYDYENDKASVVRYRAAGNDLGEINSFEDLPKRMGRQVVNLYNGYPQGFEGVSIFNDIQGSIGELSRMLNYLSTTIRRNSTTTYVWS